MDYREIISDKFEERRRVNARYSLRAFARDLKISPSRLSDVLASKGNLSVDKARQIAKLLTLNPLVTKDFIDLVEASGRGVESVKSAAKKRIQTRSKTENLRRISDDELSIMSDWRNLAVWTFMTLPAFDGQRNTIAKHFKMNVIEVEDILRRLERLKMVSLNGKTGAIGNTQAYAGGSFPSPEVRVFHRQISELGREAIESQAYTERHAESAILTIDKSKYGEIEQKIANFCRSLVKDYSDQPANNSVYGLSLTFFKLAVPLHSP